MKRRVRLRVLAEEPDSRVLECAAEGRADVIVWGDRHLRTRREVQGIRIVRPVDFLRTLSPEEQ